MKNLILPTLILLLNLTLTAQTNTFPTTDAIWVNRFQNYYHNDAGNQIFYNERFTKYCVNGVDTTINSIIYTELNKCSAINSNYHGAIREDLGKIYFMPADSTSEFLLYDFAANVGETIDILIQSGSDSAVSYWINSVSIDAVDSIMVNNQLRRRLTVDANYWIEGIGCTSGLFMEPHYFQSNYSLDLYCMSSDGTNLYDMTNGGPNQQGVGGACDLYLAINDNEILTNSISIFPNPTAGKVMVELSNQQSLKQVKIINSQGQIIQSLKSLNNKYLDLEITGAAGIYFMEIYTEDHQKTVQKIVKQ